MARILAPGVSSDSAGYILRRLESDVFLAFGNKSSRDITPADIRDLIKAIKSGEGNGRRFEGKGARDVAQRQHGTINQIFRCALAHELAETNPASAFKPGDVLKARKKQNRAHIDPPELPALLFAMENYTGQVVVRLALQLMTPDLCSYAGATGCPWSEFDLDCALWKIEPDRMKKNRPHIVPLSRQALSILRQLKETATEKRFVFPGLNTQTADGTINCNSLLNALADIGYKGVMTGHGYRSWPARSSLKTILRRHMLSCSYPMPMTTRRMPHTIPRDTCIQRKALMQWWADFLDSELAKRTTIG